MMEQPKRSVNWNVSKAILSTMIKTKQDLSSLFSSFMITTIKAKIQMMKRMNNLLEMMKIWIIMILKKPLTLTSYSSAKFLKGKHVLKIHNVDTIVYVMMESVKEMKMLSVKIKMIVNPECYATIILMSKVHIIEEKSVQASLPSINK